MVAGDMPDFPLTQGAAAWLVGLAREQGLAFSAFHTFYYTKQFRT